MATCPSIAWHGMDGMVTAHIMFTMNSVPIPAHPRGMTWSDGAPRGLPCHLNGGRGACQKVQ